MSSFKGLLPLQLPSRVSTSMRKSSYLAVPMNEKDSDDSVELTRRRDSNSSTTSDPAFPTNRMRLIFPFSDQLKTLVFKRPILLIFTLLFIITLSFVIIYERYEEIGDGRFSWLRTQFSSPSPSTTTLHSTSNIVHGSESETYVEGDSGNHASTRKALPSRPIWVESHRALFKAGALVDWISQGEINGRVDLSSHSRVDGIWTWVNGTSSVDLTTPVEVEEAKALSFSMTSFFFSFQSPISLQPGSDPRHILSRQFYASDPHRIALPPNDHLSDKSLSPPRPSRPSNPNPPFAPLRQILGLPDNNKLQNTDSRFRDNGELLFSLRSAQMYLGDHLGTMHVLSTDFWEGGKPEGESLVLLPQPETSSIEARTAAFSRKELTEQRSDRFLVEGEWERLGQVPQWLDVDHESVVIGQAAVDFTESSFQEPPSLILHHDWNIFRPLRSIDSSTQALPEVTFDEAELLAWKLAHLPTFNSMAAEAYLGIGLPGLSEIFTASSDDMALGQPVSTSDFASPLYGPVLHINHMNSIYPQAHPAAGLGEAPSHHFTAWILSQRFGFRSSHYIVHIQKAHLTPLMLEARLIWGDEWSETSQKRFRGDGSAINSHLLSYGLNIERHREALLWTFFMLKVDSDGDNFINDSELDAAKLMMGWDGVDTTEKIKVPFPRRDSARAEEIDSNLLKSNFPKPLASKYEWTSMDGYAYGFNFQRGKRQWPLFYEEEDDPNPERFNDKLACTFKLKVCMKEERNADALFKNFAFQNVGCGDCLISHLIGKSGLKGLSSFLPEVNSNHSTFPKVETSIDREQVPPHLPLDKTWEAADFKMERVVRNTGWSEGNKRDFASLLIARYAYTIASAPAAFVMMVNPTNVATALKKIDEQNTVFMCFNDDITSQRDKTINILHDWYEKKFDQKLSFEL